jgi:peptidoglycan/xylan/chitin deacetylase (PgdA/CDA1 family)
MSNLPVLMYHAVASTEKLSDSTDEGDLIYVLDAEKFEAHIKYLSTNNFTSLHISDIVSGIDYPEQSVLITFDDGHISNATVALDILKKYNTKATFFITTGWIGTDNFMASTQIKKLHENGMEIGTHGVTHQYFDDLSEKEAISELVNSKLTLEEIIGEDITIFSAPGGRLCANAKKLAQDCGYKALFTSKIGLYTRKTDSFDIPRIDIKRDIDMDDFIKITEGNQQYLKKLVIRANILSLAKITLGNKLYVKVREILLDLRSNHAL